MVNLLKSFNQSVKNWYIPLILGILFIACGIYIFTTPLETYLSLSLLFILSFLVSGMGETMFSIQNHKTLNGWGWYLVSGLLSLVMGIYLILYPQISVVILPFVVGFAVMFRSFLLLGCSFDLKDVGIMSWGNLAIFAVLGIVFSILLIINPIFSSISLVILTALSFIFVGVASTILAFELKKIKDFPDKISNELKSKIEILSKDIKDQMK